MLPHASPAAAHRGCRKSTPTRRSVGTTRMAWSAACSENGNNVIPKAGMSLPITRSCSPHVCIASSCTQVDIFPEFITKSQCSATWPIQMCPPPTLPRGQVFTIRRETQRRTLLPEYHTCPRSLGVMFKLHNAEFRGPQTLHQQALDRINSAGSAYLASQMRREVPLLFATGDRHRAVCWRAKEMA